MFLFCYPICYINLYITDSNVVINNIYLEGKNINPRVERKITRISGVREVKQTFLIICEGVNTEPDYFNAFRLTSANVKAVGQGMGTLTLVQKAINIKEQEKRKGRIYNQNWVVFYKDDFPENDFNSAILLAQQNGFEVAYSNQLYKKIGCKF